MDKQTPNVSQITFPGNRKGTQITGADKPKSVDANPKLGADKPRLSSSEISQPVEMVGANGRVTLDDLIWGTVQVLPPIGLDDLVFGDPYEHLRA